MTTGGEGGMVTTSDAALWSSAWSYKDHGKSWQAVYERAHPPGFRWVHESIGTNWRMMEMQGVIGRIQLARMADWTAKRTAHAMAIFEVARQSDAVRVPEVPAHVRHAFYKAYMFVRPETLASGWTRDRIVAEINARGAPCYQGTASEVYLEKAFDTAPGRPTSRLPEAKKLGETSIMFLVHPTLTEDDIAMTRDAVNSVLKSAER